MSRAEEPGIKITLEDVQRCANQLSVAADRGRRNNRVIIVHPDDPKWKAALQAQGKEEMK